jgi:clan AA aspartic protease (TIGR02281 family)
VRQQGLTGHRPGGRPRRRPPVAPALGARRPLAVSLRSVGLALGWVLLGLGSLAALVVATWILGSMARGAMAHGGGAFQSAAWAWAIAIFVTLLLPFGVAVWKHQGDPRRISLTMAWLPMLWNATGLLLATQIIPDVMATALRGHGAWMMRGHLGDSHSTTRVMSALGHQSADLVDPGSDPETAPRGTAALLANEALEDVDHGRTISVPMAEDGTAILMTATLEGPSGRVELPYLFDTGASYTTMTTDTARRLGIAVPDDAPILTFNTASGPRESRMVHLPAIELGRVRIEGLLASVCDKCANEHSEGLLGLNVMRQFYMTMDYRAGRMLLVPRIGPERPNRALDIRQVVELDVEGNAELWLGRVRWVLLVKNRSTMPLYDVVPIVRFTDGPTLRGAKIDRIEPGQTGRSLVEGRASHEGGPETKGHYTLGLEEAFW